MYEEIVHGITENSAKANRRCAFPAFVLNKCEILPSVEIERVGKKVIFILYKSLIRRTIN